MPALHSACGRKGRQAKLGGVKLRGSLEQSGFVRVLMIYKMLLDFFTGLQKLLWIFLSPVPYFLPHTEATPRTDSLVWYKWVGQVLAFATPGDFVLALPLVALSTRGVGVLGQPAPGRASQHGAARHRAVTCVGLEAVRLCLRTAAPSAEKRSGQNFTCFSAPSWKCAYFIPAALSWCLDWAVPLLPGVWLVCVMYCQMCLHPWGGYAWRFTVLTLWLWFC